MIMLFNKRKEWADRYEQWRTENNVLDCAISVISFRVANKWVPVVMCKDCVHRPKIDPDYESGFDIHFPDDVCPCQCDDGWYNWNPKDDWYCACGERRHKK